MKPVRAHAAGIRRRPAAFAVAVAVVTATAVAGVANGGGFVRFESAPPSDAVAAADRDAEFRIVISSGATSFDPHRTASFTTDQIYQRQVYDGLLTIGRGEDGEVVLVPQLAASYEYADDGLSVEFELREGVTFQDGTPFDAEAVKANIERALDPESTVSSMIASVESVEAVDDVTVVLHLAHPDSSLVWALASGTVGNMASPAAFESDLSTAPVGTGPFRLVSYTEDAEVVYERWDDHWDPDAALLRELTIATIPDVTARYNGLRSGEFDAAYLQAPLDFESASLEEDGYHRDVVLSPISIGMLLNSDVPPFDDVRVRQAVSHAINRAEISATVLNGLNPPVYQPFNPGVVGFDPELDVDPYDVDASRALIDDAGAAGAAIELLHTNSPPNDTLAPIVQAALNEIGLEVELLPLSATEARTAWRTGEYQAAILPIIAQVDPGQTLASSYLAADNPATPPAELAELAAAAAALVPGSEEQANAYQEISAYLVENPVHVPIAQFSTVIVSQPDVVGSADLLTTGIADMDFRYVGVAAS